MILHNLSYSTTHKHWQPTCIHKKNDVPLLSEIILQAIKKRKKKESKTHFGVSNFLLNAHMCYSRKAYMQFNISKYEKFTLYAMTNDNIKWTKRI